MRARKTIGEAVRQIGVSEQTYSHWRKKYGGMNISEARKYRELEKENARLKKLVADLSLDNAILKDVAEGNFMRIYAPTGQTAVGDATGAGKVPGEPTPRVPGDTD